MKSPLRPCHISGCASLVREDQPCATHGPKRKSELTYAERVARNPIARKLYDSARWKRLRRQVLDDQPLCVDCLAQGKTEIAVEVHHEKPVVDFPELALDRNNCVGLCSRCHTLRTLAEQRQRRETRPAARGETR